MANPTLNLRPSKLYAQGAVDPGVMICEDGGNYFIGPWEWVTFPNPDEDGGPTWSAPLGAPGINYTSLGSDPGARLSVAGRQGMEDALGYARGTLPASNLTDILANFVLGSLADPRGVTAVKPLRSSPRQGRKLYLGGVLILDEPFNASNPDFDRTLAVRWEDYRRNKTEGMALATLRRWTGHDVQKYFGRTSPLSSDLDALLPPEHRTDGWLRPRTLVTEDWDCANSDSLNCDLTWTEFDAAGYKLASNKAENADGASKKSARADSDLSSDDHYAQAILSIDASARRIGCAVRFSSSAHTCYVGIWRGNTTNGVKLYEVTTGTFTTFFTVSPTNALTNGDLVKVTVNDSTITIENVTRSESHNDTDTTHTGQVRTGISRDNSGTADTWNDFEAADLAAAAGEQATIASFVRSRSKYPLVLR